MADESPKVASCRQQWETPAVGLLTASECVVRGGFLRRPIVLQGCLTEGGKQFMYLWKTSPAIHGIFAPASSCRRQLSKTLVFEELKQARSKRCAEMLKEELEELAALRIGGGNSGAENPTAALDLDKADVSPERGEDTGCGSGARGRRMKKVALAQLPPCVQIVVPLADGGSWEPWVIATTNASEAVAIECTAESLGQLSALLADQQAKQDKEITEPAADGGTPQRRARATLQFDARGTALWFIPNALPPTEEGSLGDRMFDKSKNIFPMSEEGPLATIFNQNET